MNIFFKKSLILIAVILAFTAVISFDSSISTRNTSGHRNVSVDEVRKLFLESEFKEFYAVINAGFPTEIESFFAEMITVINDQTIPNGELNEVVFLRGRSFTENLRIENSYFISQAPMEQIMAIQIANLDVLNAIQSDKLLCAKYAAYGGSALQRDEASRIPSELITRTAVETFKAIAAGKNYSTVYPPITMENWDFVFSTWIEQPNTDPKYLDILSIGNSDNPELCDAAVSFQDFIVNSDHPKVLAVVPELSRLSMETE